MKIIANLILSVFLVSGALWAEETVPGLQVGDTVPAFSANEASGDLWRLEDHLGQKNVVVYFYPAAMTGGCTAQACAYRDQSVELNEMDAVVVGVSGDAVNGLKLFKQAHGLNFALLSDVNGYVARLFGVPTRDGGAIERSLDGELHVLQRGLTTSRWTFVVDKQGEVIYKNEQVKAAADSAAVIEALKAAVGG